MRRLLLKLSMIGVTDTGESCRGLPAVYCPPSLTGSLSLSWLSPLADIASALHHPRCAVACQGLASPLPLDRRCSAARPGLMFFAHSERQGRHSPPRKQEGSSAGIRQLWGSAKHPCKTHLFDLSRSSAIFLSKAGLLSARTTAQNFAVMSMPQLAITFRSMCLQQYASVACGRRREIARLSPFCRSLMMTVCGRSN